MHGLILRTVQIFLQDTYGVERWSAMAVDIGLDTPEFEAMLHYSDQDLAKLLVVACDNLKKPVETLLEDVGTYLVSHPNSAAIRRLLRFCGVDFIEFLYSLEALPDRIRMAVNDLELPVIELHECGSDRFQLRVIGKMHGFGHVLVGVLRALADDYGTLALLEHSGRIGEFEEISITVVQTDFQAGRAFHLADSPDVKRTG